jgi:hypothetical protein
MNAKVIKRVGIKPTEREGRAVRATSDLIYSIWKEMGDNNLVRDVNFNTYTKKDVEEIFTFLLDMGNGHIRLKGKVK